MRSNKIRTLLLFALINFAVNAQEIVKTKSGRKIILYANHTWEYYEVQKKQSEPKRQSLPKKPGDESNKIKLSPNCEFLYLSSSFVSKGKLKIYMYID